MKNLTFEGIKGHYQNTLTATKNKLQHQVFVILTTSLKSFTDFLQIRPKQHFRNLHRVLICKRKWKIFVANEYFRNFNIAKHFTSMNPTFL